MNLLYIIFLINFHFHLAEVPLERWLLEVKPNEKQCLDSWWVANGFEKGLYLKKELRVGNWFVVEVPKSYSSALKQLPCVKSILIDEKLKSYSTIPNDPLFFEQTDMSLIGMPHAWDFTTGGLTTRGDTIVVAVLDDGFQTNHEDLIENLWHNKGEIPNDGLDNDGNGYIDDYTGLNTVSGTDKHPLFSHGTSVSGIIGARGNNSLGMSGINWHVKIMFISYNHHISELVEGYQYVLEMRKKYNETNGEEGAFVVAVNLSSGIDFALPENYPLWCSMYDKLGAEGVLSVCTAPNFKHSVDVGGGMPSRCTSPFTINVTNVSPDDVIMGNAGFGRMSIDLGAPGERSLTTDTSNTYNYFRGTSSAAPHVAGTVALLYSVPCELFFSRLTSHPSDLAIKIKNVILASGTPNPSLKGITLTENRLQVDAAVKVITSSCDIEVHEKLSIRFISPNPAGLNGMRIFFETVSDPASIFFDLYSITGIKVNSRQINQEEYHQGFIALETRSLVQGLYIITLRNQNQITTAKVFIH